METATFGAGCFWGVESVFEQVDGVVATKVGYTGGFTDAPSYEDVCSHRTGHAEAVEVTFDPARVSYDKLLDIFWMNHDPTQVNRRAATSARSRPRSSLQGSSGTPRSTTRNTSRGVASPRPATSPPRANQPRG
jgi:methionine-S-sulfoxide reductase